MKLLRCGPEGNEIPALQHKDGTLRDISDHIDSISGAGVSIGALARLRELDPGALPVIEGNPRIGPCLSSVSNFVCIGLNYARHAAETGAELPKEPLVFSKVTSALTGPYDRIVIPKGSTSTDWEVELGVIIGRECSYVSESDALDHVAGYCTYNDVSERDYQKNRGGQWVKGKSAPTFAPMGPWLVTADEVPDPQNLSLKTWVNGAVMQDSNTSDMIFSVAKVISYLSEMMTLMPGDVIATGTPEGVAAGRTPPNFLRAGDLVEIEVEGLGKQQLDVVTWPG